jgi:hypothetical protein
LRGSGDALMALIQRRQLREHGIVCVGHGGRARRKCRKWNTGLRGRVCSQTSTAEILIDGW